MPKKMGVGRRAASRARAAGSKQGKGKFKGGSGGGGGGAGRGGGAFVVVGGVGGQVVAVGDRTSSAHAGFDLISA